ncbi:MAG TPA: DivIVA domain-containing protein [Longimicrobiales bacterium]|nr:DivIVA domain-containing protein [Longimicrobiales bacterium]
MIDLTPLDVRKKREDFRRTFRGYDPEEVDTFLGLVAERFEELVKENLMLTERTERLQEQVSSQLGRERAVQEALVTAQEIRDDIRGQAQREAEEIRGRVEREAGLLRKEAEAEREALVARATRELQRRQDALEELERKRLRFLRSFRALLERELDGVEVEEGRPPLEEAALELDLGGGWEAPGATGAEEPSVARVGPEEALSIDAGAGEPPTEDTGAEGWPEEPLAVEGGQEEEPLAVESGPAEPLTVESGDVEPSGLPPAADTESSPSSDAADPEGLSADQLPGPDQEGEEDDPRRWLSSLVERELNEKSDEGSWS